MAVSYDTRISRLEVALQQLQTNPQIKTVFIDPLAELTAGVADGSITAAKILDGSVTAPKIAALAVGAAAIADLAVTAAKIADATITTAKIGDAQITSAKIADLVADKITAGSGIIVNLTIGATLTLGAGGKIVDADGSEWNENGLFLAAGAAAAECIRFSRTGFTPVGNIASAIGTNLSQLNIAVVLDPGAANGGASLLLNRTNVDDATTNATLQVKKTGSVLAAEIILAANGSIQFTRTNANDATALGAYYGRWPMIINGLTRYIPLYN